MLQIGSFRSKKWNDYTSDRKNGTIRNRSIPFPSELANEKHVYVTTAFPSEHKTKLVRNRSFSFHFYIFLEGYPSALLVFKGLSFKKKNNIYIQLIYNDYNTTKKREKYHKSYIYTLQEKINGANRT